METIKKLKEKAQKLKNEIVVLYYAYKNPATPLLVKFIIIFTVGYALSPIDLIPDFIPVLGYLDDLIILPALIALSIKLIPKTIISDARELAKTEPLILKKNWFFAILFILIWIVILSVIVLSLFRLFSA